MRLVGEDIVATELIIPENHVIRPVDMAAMLASGHTAVMVRQQPGRLHHPDGHGTGGAGQRAEKGRYHRFQFHACSPPWQRNAARQPCERRSSRTIRTFSGGRVLDALAGSDLVVINAGSSAGREDFTADVIAGLGQVVVHGVAIKPGKPVILGIVQGKPVIGIPGIRSRPRSPSGSS